MAKTRSAQPFKIPGNPNHQSGNCQIIRSHHSILRNSASTSGAKPPTSVACSSSICCLKNSAFFTDAKLRRSETGSNLML
jgi:hypothetical protein